MAPFQLSAEQITAVKPRSGIQSLLDALPSAAYTCNAAGKITAFNAKAIELWGRTPRLNDDQDLYCGSWRLHTEAGEPLRHDQCWMARALIDGVAYADRRAVVERPDGSRRLVVANVNPVFDLHGKVVGALNVLVDVTERARAEADLRASEERLKLALGAAGMGVYEWNVATDEVYWSPECRSVLGPEFDLASSGAVFRAMIHDDALLGVVGDFDRAVRQREAYDLEFRFRRSDGEVRWLAMHGRPRADGGDLVMIGALQDVTRRKQAERVVLRQNQVLELIASGAPLKRTLAEIARLVESQLPGSACVVTLLDDDGQVIRGSIGPSLPDAYHELIKGIRIGEGVGSCGTSAFRRAPVVSEDTETDPLWRGFETLTRTFGLRACWSSPIIAGDDDAERRVPARVYGTFGVYFRTPAAPRDGQMAMLGRCAHLASIAVERNRFEAMLLAEESRFRTFVDHATDAFFLLREDDGMILDVNRRSCESLGYSREQLIGRTPQMFGTRASPQFFREMFAKLRRGESVVFDSIHHRSDGTSFPVEIRIESFVVGGERRALAAARDITERKRSEQLVLESERRYRMLAERAQVVLWEADPQTFVFTYVSEFAESLLGYSRSRWYEPGFWAANIHTDDRDAAVDFCLTQTNAGEDHRFEYRMVRADGSIVWIEDVVTIVKEPAGIALRGVMVDITERKRADAQLRASEIRNRALVEANPDMIFRLDGEGRLFDFHAPPNAELLMTPDKFLGRLPHEYLPPHVADLVQAKWHEALTTRQMQSLAYELEVPNGGVRSYDARMMLSGENEVVAVVRDVTESKHLEDQVRKLQKVEAVGRLAGGIAHDFNNLLTVVNGYSELLLRKFPTEDPRRPSLVAVRDAGRRAAGLVRQLLAFSREQALRLEALDVDEVLTGLEPMIRGLLTTEVTIDWRLAAGGYFVRTDRSQLEQAVLNLVANARDAMARHGRLTIRTDVEEVATTRPAAVGEVRPGRYVRLSVIDDGHGMTPDVMSKIFEPFFTTKEIGRGTGLGLPAVDGIVRQSGGCMEVVSEVGAGTSISLLLPVHTSS
jgi:PAS domain S-box-containing protein